MSMFLNILSRSNKSYEDVDWIERIDQFVVNFVPVIERIGGGSWSGEKVGYRVGQEGWGQAYFCSDCYYCVV